MQATNVEASAIVIGAHKGGTSNSKVVAMSVHRVVTFKSDPFLFVEILVCQRNFVLDKSCLHFTRWIVKIQDGLH